MNELEEPLARSRGVHPRAARVGHLSLRKLSEMAGISNPYLSQIERGPAQAVGRDPPADRPGARDQLRDPLRAGRHPRAPRGRDRPRHEIRRDPWLNEEQKKTLVQIYESFRAERRAARLRPGGARRDSVSSRPTRRATRTPRRRRFPSDPESGGARRAFRSHCDRARRPLPALVAARPAGHRRQRRHERVRAGAGGLARPGGRRHHGLRARWARPAHRGGGGARVPGGPRRRPVPPTWPRSSCPRPSTRSPSRWSRSCATAPSTSCTPTTGCRAWPATG
jgi:hypothetical protein